MIWPFLSFKEVKNFNTKFLHKVIVEWEQKNPKLQENILILKEEEFMFHFLFLIHNIKYLKQ